MLRHKPLVASLILAGLIAATDASALGLGRLNVTTALGQPLVAEVDLATSAGDDVDSIRANVASPAVYRSASIEYQSILQNVRAQVLKRPNGQPYIRLASSQAINDPYLDILLEVNSSTGRLVREFVFLLDPPGAAAPQAIEPSQPARPPMPAQSVPVATASVPASARADNSVTPTATPASNGSTYTVKKGDTLSTIAGRTPRSGVSLEQLMIAIQRVNPNAFIDNNINRLRSGVTLTLPTGTEAQSIAQSTAVSEIHAQASSWRGYIARASDSVPTVSADQATARASGRVSGAVADTGTALSNSDKLKVSQGERTKQANTESKVAATKALKEEQSRIAALEKIKQDAAIALQNQKLAEAQAKAREAAKPAPAPVAVAPVAPPPPPVAPIAKVEPPKVEPPKVEPPKAEPPKVDPPKAAEAPKPEPVTAPAPAPMPAVAATPAPAVAAAPAPAPSPTPKPAAVAAAPAVPETSMLDGLLSNPLIPAGGGLAVLLGGVILWSKRRKTNADPVTSSKLLEPVVNTMNPDTVFGTSGLGVVKTNDVPVQSQFSRSGMGTIDSSEVDPVAEAEVYIAYGREAQAEEILREALIRDPHRPDVATKLAEISAAQGRREEFDRISADVLAMDRSGEYRQKLADIALAHFPGHSLTNSVESASKNAASLSLAAATTEIAAVAGVTSATSLISDGESTADIFAPAPTPEPPVNHGALDFVLDGMAITKPAAEASPIVAPVQASLAPQATAIPSFAPTPSSSASRKSLEQDLAELEESLKKATSSGKLPESNMDFTDFSTATPTNLGTVGPSMRPEMLDLSFDAGRQGFVDPTPSILDGQWHDASTKLDLARAYEEMGDREGAREILREVIHDGDEAQRNEAKAMLAKLGG